jgi:hypothetical protein
LDVEHKQTEAKWSDFGLAYKIYTFWEKSTARSDQSLDGIQACENNLITITFLCKIARTLFFTVSTRRWRARKTIIEDLFEQNKKLSANKID